MQRPDLFEAVDAKGYRCQCCQQWVQTYHRRVNANMAIAAICVYRHGGGKFVHVENLLQEKGYKRCGDFSYLTHLGVFQKMEGKRPDNSKRNGHYRLTAFGTLFVEGKATVKEKFLIYNNNCTGFEGKDITIKEALGEKFSFEILMNS